MPGRLRIINKRIYQSVFIDTNVTVPPLLSLGVVDNLAIESSIKKSKKARGKYKKYTNEQRFEMGKFASENGPAACVRRFKTVFPKLNESTVREFKKKI